MSERARAEFCGEVIRYTRAHAPTRRNPDVIRAQREERPDDMADLLVTLPRGGWPDAVLSMGGCSSYEHAHPENPPMSQGDER